MDPEAVLIAMIELHEEGRPDAARALLGLLETDDDAEGDDGD